MLTPAQVIPFLQHEDPNVRDHAAEYLAKAHDPSPATADDFWAAIDRYGMKVCQSLITSLYRLPQTDGSVERTLAALGSEDDLDKPWYLLRVVQELDLALLSRHREAIWACEALTNASRQHMERRLSLVNEPLDALWESLVLLAARYANDDEEEEEEEDLFGDQHEGLESDRLVEAIARHGEPAAARAIAVLQDDSISDWRENWCIQIVGKLRWRPALNALLGKMRAPDADMYWDVACSALARIGDGGVVAAIADAFESESETFRELAPGLLGRIKLPESELACIRLLSGVEDDWARTDLCVALCDLCTTEGFDAVHEIARTEQYDESYVDLEESILTLGTMIGREVPEAAEWRKRIARDDQRRQHLEAKSERFGRLAALPKLDAFDPTPHEEFDLEPPHPPAEVDEYYRPPATFVRDAPKIGRNDPCPCGSGKKYKKCCGK